MNGEPLDKSGRRLGPFRAPRGLVRRLGEGAMALLLCVFVVGTIDFVRFVASIADHENGSPAASDGIVALTGGAERISDALDLMAANRAKRLLITGVNAGTSQSTLAATTPKYRVLFACCVDIDRNALNTLGNALETVRWARRNEFRSLIIVTSSYHMPRALLELSRLAPDLELAPYPVVPTGLRMERWWADSPTRRLIVGEYFKFLMARAYLRFDEPTADATSQTMLGAG